MATSRGSAIASPQIFSSDPVEQIFARGMDGPNGGLLYGLMAAARLRREGEQEQYMEALEKSNSVAAMIQKLQMQQEIDKEAMKQAGDLAAKGYLPSDMPALDAVFGGNRKAGDPTALLLQAAIKAKIANDQAGAASSGQAGAPKYSVKSYGVAGNMPLLDINVQARDPSAAATGAVNVRKALSDAYAKAGLAPPTAAQVREFEDAARRNQPGTFQP